VKYIVSAFAVLTIKLSPAILPNSLLIFEVELLGIENQEGSGGDTVELPKQ
jgi:hypothetical protein